MQAERQKHADTVELQYLRALTEKVDTLADLVRHVIGGGDVNAAPAPAAQEPRRRTPKKKAATPHIFPVGDKVQVIFQDTNWYPAVVSGHGEYPHYRVDLSDPDETVEVQENFLAHAVDEARILAIEENRLPEPHGTAAAEEEESAEEEEETQEDEQQDDSAETEPEAAATPRRRGPATGAGAGATPAEKKAAYNARVEELLAGVPYDLPSVQAMIRQDVAKLAKALGGSGQEMLGKMPELCKLVMSKQKAWMKKNRK